MADNYIDVTLSEIFGTGVASVEQTETSAEPGGYNVWTITLTNGHTSTFTVRNGTAGGSPMPVLNSVDMTDTTGIYLYLGNEEGYVTGHWYCYANDAWTDYGAYSEKGDPGLAPTVEVSKTGGTTTITITDAEGEHVATIEDGISPTVNVANTAAEMTDTSLIYVYAGSETNYVVGDWYFYDSYIGQWRSGGQYQSTVPSIDSTLTVQGAAADAKKTGDEINDLKSQISSLSSIPTAVKNALDTLFQNVAFKNDDVYTDEIAVVHNWATAVNLISISAVYTQGSTTVTPNTSLESLKSDLVVTANYDNGTTETVSSYAYELSGTLTEGTSTITVNYEGKTTTFTVEVSDAYLYVLSSPFTSTGTDVIDTNVGFEAGKTYTFMCDHTRTGTTSAVSYIYGNKSTSNIYLALQNQNNYLWGVGIPYDNGNNLGQLDKRIRTVAVVTFDSEGNCTADINYRNVTDGGVVRTFNNSYTNILSNTKTVCLGDSVGAGRGALATVHDFRVYDGEMPSADITDYLTNGAS